MNKDEFVELLTKSQEEILERVDSKLQDLKRSISEDQEDCVRSVVKKFKEDHSINWKKVGNEKQFKFNESVEAKIDSAIAAVDKKKLEKVKKELEEDSRRGTDDAFKSFRQPFQFRTPLCNRPSGIFILAGFSGKNHWVGQIPTGSA